MSAGGRSATVEFGGGNRRNQLHLGLLSDLQCVVDLDPKVSDGTFKLGVPKEELNR